MSAQKPITREYRIYLALWRKALKSEEQVIFKASNFGMAVAIRQGMYRAIRPFRYSEIEDQELRLAAEKFIVVLVKNFDGKEPKKENHRRDLPHWIELRARATLEEMNSIFDELDIAEDDLYVGEERIMSEKLKELAEKGPKPIKSKTKFYERD